jgi:hypothetical protein
MKRSKRVKDYVKVDVCGMGRPRVVIRGRNTVKVCLIEGGQGCQGWRGARVVVRNWRDGYMCTHSPMLSCRISGVVLFISCSTPCCLRISMKDGAPRSSRARRRRLRSSRDIRSAPTALSFSAVTLKSSSVSIALSVESMSDPCVRSDSPSRPAHVPLRGARRRPLGGAS